MEEDRDKRIMLHVELSEAMTAQHARSSARNGRDNELMMQRLRISRRTTAESSQTSRRSAPVRQARLPSMYHDHLDDVARIS
jgi:hypothetical protein